MSFFVVSFFAFAVILTTSSSLEIPIQKEYIILPLCCLNTIATISRILPS